MRAPLKHYFMGRPCKTTSPLLYGGLKGNLYNGDGGNYFWELRR